MMRRLLFLALPFVAVAVLAQDKKKDDLGDIIDDVAKGTRFRLVALGKEDDKLDASLYWRSAHGSVAARTTPVRFRAGDVDLIAPVLNPKADTSGREAYVYPVEGRAKLGGGRHRIEPGELSLLVEGGNITSNHPAVKVGKDEVLIRCAPVRLEVVDERGVPVPTAIKIGDARNSYLREETRFSVLTVYLPVGGEYQSSLGSFRVEADGRIKALRIGDGVKLTPEGLKKIVPVEPIASPPTAAETIRLSGPGKDKQPGPSCRLFVATVVKPGNPVWAAVSRREYKTETGNDFAQNHFRVTFDDKELPHVGVGRPDRDVIGRATRALNCQAEDLGWIAPVMPASAFGPVSLSLSTRYFGNSSVAVLAQDLSTLHLLPHRGRTVFSRDESAVYSLLVPRGSKEGEAKVMVRIENRKAAVELGKLTVPEVTERDFDSRSFTVTMRDLPPGAHELWIKGPNGDSGKVPMKVVSMDARSPFFTHSMSGCTSCWPTTEEGMRVLEEANLDMVAATGSLSNLDTRMPRIDESLAGRLRRLGLPADLALTPASNDRLLERLLKHRLKFIDMTVVRASGFYMEGLSYHHSYQPNVDRMVRRMQIFAQQTADYPSMWGVNYSWFPQLYGYSEGGVPTDAHVGERNRALEAAAKATGVKPLTREETDWLNKNKSDPAAREKVLALMKQAVAWRNTTQELGWGKHNKLYNDAVRQVKPDMAFTLFENAGHDEPKRLASMFKDMNAQCYESYTDFGDWPMSAGFVVDWSHGQSPGQPVWLTTCWGTSEEGKMKSLFHAFARGLEGGGVPMQGTFPLSTLARRGKGLRFVSQYGAVARNAKPDARVAILARDAHAVFGRLIWDVHAVYSHLTRLGHPPVVLNGDTAVKGIPEATKALVLVKEEMPLEPELRQGIDAFRKRGGKVVVVGPCCDVIDDAIIVKETPKHLWDLKGFHPESHEAMWKEFEHLRGPLTEAMSRTGLKPLATVEPSLGYALAMDAGPLRYVAVIGEVKGAHSNTFEPTSDIPVSLDGTGWKVRDLVKQKNLKTEEKDGRTLVKVDLTTEPTTLLALYREAPAKLSAWVRYDEASTLSCEIDVLADRSIILGPVPVRLTLRSPDGSLREEISTAARTTVKFPIAAHDLRGVWKLTIQELLTGLSATMDVKIEERTPRDSTAHELENVHVVAEDRLKEFARRKGEKLIVLEPEQAHLIPVAQRLVETIRKQGSDARVWTLRPEDLEAHPIRWYPTPADRERLKAIEDGRLVGIRQSLTPFIDTIKRVHVPDRGGHDDIVPQYMVGKDCIVFSGGRLAESLRAVTSWMELPHNPGKGKGRLVVCFSPFHADRQVVAVVGNDATGLDAAARVLGETFGSKKLERSGGTLRNDEQRFQEVKSERLPVPTPYAGHTPLQRVERLLTTSDGKAALFLKGKKDNLALVDREGKVTASVRVDPLLASQARLDAKGELVLPIRKVTATHPGWGFPTEIELTLGGIASDGKLKREMVAYRGEIGPADFEGGIRWSEDGSTAFLGRAGGFLWRTKDDMTWRRYDDTPHATLRFSVLYPRRPTGVTFSPDGRFVLFTMDSRPPFGGLNSAAPHPWSVETVLFDLKEGKRVWALQAPEGKSTHAVHTRFASVSRDADMTVLVDYDGTFAMIDKRGKVVLSEKFGEPAQDGGGRVGPHGGIGCWITPSAGKALAAFRSCLVTINNSEFTRIPLSGITSACLSNGHAIAACDDGKVHAFDMVGMTKWTIDVGSASPLVAPGKDATLLVALGNGTLLLLDGKGKEVRRTDVAAVADRETHEPEPADDIVRVVPPVEYVEPNTLTYAKEKLSAKEVTGWKPKDEGVPAFGRFFHSFEGKTELSAADAGEYFVHLVYRRPTNNKSLKVLIDGKDGPETFLLDLPTPEYRVIDIPVRGPKAKVTLTSDGPAEVAEFSLWSMKWPGTNLAYVRPAGGEEKPTGKGDDILDDLEGKKNVSGKLKDCRVWWPNTDFDAVRGPWLPAPLDPLAVVDGKRFQGGRLAPWCNKYLNFPPCKGGIFSIDLTEEQTPRLLATYDRSTRQSEVSGRLAVFAFDAKDPLTAGAILAGAGGDDQFWRLIPIEGKVRRLGVHVFRDEQTGAGLSEVELYR